MEMVIGKYQKPDWRTFLVFVFKRSAIVFMLIVVAVAAPVAKLYKDIWKPPLITSTIPGEVFDLVSGISILGAVFLLAAAVAIAGLEYFRYAYKMGSDTLEIRRGMIHVKETAIPYRRIKGIDTHESLLYQLLGLSDVIIELTVDINDYGNKKGENSDEFLPAIPRGVAQAIQEEISHRANIERVHIHDQYGKKI